MPARTFGNDDLTIGIYSGGIALSGIMFLVLVGLAFCPKPKPKTNKSNKLDEDVEEERRVLSGNPNSDLTLAIERLLKSNRESGTELTSSNVMV